MVINFYGWYYWLRGHRTDHDIRIEALAFTTAWLHIAIAALGGLVFGLSLKYFTDAAVPMLDAQLAAFSLLATYWTSRKHITTWLLWVLIDVIYVGMFTYKELFLTAWLYAAFVLMAGLGWWQWQQVRHKQILQSQVRL